ncbi:hypothetical protein P168DRAFT_324884 [Aspergillus campestris IBT 28561]|uniref:Mannosyltransferase n=1 Tax=Aspergillus campestris (strain IBT 28561) TaxID=1392248 RepID=A0A2I1DC79_ASPC2|nr:uncharacterized protein P168DRAFT_324884 [Aspergillus campestris IBT 28561]PKY07477.1 hypothetical protein P168DRAFT_324884 [Aspergillus campestris IBT 28561]
MGRDIVWYLLLLSIPVLVLFHLSVAPYTKVEESFHIQAVHDLLHSGIPTRNVADTLRSEYDHFSFPGAVPRTFVGAVALSGLSRPWIDLKAGIDRQWLARAILGIANSFALMSFASGVRRAFGQTTAVWYLLFQASQFHVIYYASRTLSNMFAFGIATVALRCILPEPVAPRVYWRRCRLALFLLTVAGIIFRSELALLLATTTIALFCAGRIDIVRDIIPAGFLGVLVGLACTVGVDSFFWQRFPLWPELSAFQFNVVSGHAAAWGTQPWHFYFTNALPRLLLNPLTYLIGLPYAFKKPATRSAATYILLPPLAFIALYSTQPHKEWRFILYAIPPLTATSALGASYIWTRRAKTTLNRLLSLALIASTLASFLLSNLILLPASAANYPGATALRTLHANAHNTQPAISVHLGNLACQTGITRFLQKPPTETRLVMAAPAGAGLPALRHARSTWSYDKTEDPARKADPAFWSPFDYILVEPGEQHTNPGLVASGPWEPLETVDGFAGVAIVKPGEEAAGTVEERVLRELMGSRAVDVYEGVRDWIRRRVTRGWWMEVRMQPKIMILKRGVQ